MAVFGAGAVGAVYGLHLQRGGAEIVFVVRQKYVDEVRAGIRMYRGSRDHTGELLVAEQVVGDVEELRGQALDQVWLCVPSTSIDEATLQKIASATGDALIVDMAPGLDGRSLRIFGRARLVDGLIPFISYQTPLPGVPAEADRDGIAYWLPPLTPTALSGPGAAEAASALVAGGMTARAVKDVESGRAVGSALLMGVIATLEVSGWDLKRARARLDGAVGQAVDAMARANHVRGTLVKLVAQPAIARMVLWLAPVVVPLPLERYLAYHFTKVGAQTRAMLKSYLDAADKAGLAAPELREITRQIEALPPRS
ncbi:MAG TPA: 2-dehydropantoate 2-reductase N-terminal domain-containing protein [Myxococcota bacterium]